MKVNLKYYDGNDHYSDGNIELELLKIVKSKANFEEIVRKDKRWPILYHFSKIRENILNWYPFKRDASLLEIGAGCGALTGLFCNNLESVTAVELSKRRAEIIAHRYPDFDNLEIMAGNLSNMTFNLRFDYITLIGVLEYADKFTNSPEPYIGFLKNIKNFLVPTGKILIAIENKFGLKYWAGAREDHTGRFFDSIEGYPDNREIRTFGKYELEQMLIQSGFSKIQFYYPFPDYKLPYYIYSEDKMPTEEDLLWNAPSYDKNRYQLFNENLAFKQIIRNKMFPFFSNSFLIEVSF